MGVLKIKEKINQYKEFLWFGSVLTSIGASN